MRYTDYSKIFIFSVCLLIISIITSCKSTSHQQKPNKNHGGLHLTPVQDTTASPTSSPTKSGTAPSPIHVSLANIVHYGERGSPTPSQKLTDLTILLRSDSDHITKATIHTVSFKVTGTASCKNFRLYESSSNVQISEDNIVYTGNKPTIIEFQIHRNPELHTLVSNIPIHFVVEGDVRSSTFDQCINVELLQLDNQNIGQVGLLWSDEKGQKHTDFQHSQLAHPPQTFVSKGGGW